MKEPGIRLVLVESIDSATCGLSSIKEGETQNPSWLPDLLFVKREIN